jgi:hypothetical protein
MYKLNIGIHGTCIHTLRRHNTTLLVLQHSTTPTSKQTPANTAHNTTNSDLTVIGSNKAHASTSQSENSGME